MSKYISGIKSTSFSLDVNGIVSTTNIPGATSIPGVSIGLNGLATAAMELTSTGTSSYIDFTKLNVDYGGRVLYDHTANEMQIFTNLATTAEVFINNAGNMGIGARSATYKLETTGDIMARNSFLRTTGNTGMFNDTYGSGWYMIDSTAMRVINDKHIATAGNIYVTNVNPTGVINLLNDQSIYFQTNSTQNRIHYDSTNTILAFDTNAVYKFFTNTALQMTINTGNVTLPNGNTLFTTNIDSVTQNVAVGFYTTKPTQSVATFNVYNNNTDKLVLFAVNTAGINGGANNVVVTPQLLVNNAILVANNTGVENLLQNMATTTGAPINLIMPNLSAGNYTLLRLGSAINTYNTAEIRFSYVGSQNSANSLGIGFYGVNPLYVVTASGAHTFIGKNALFSIPVAITNVLSVTNATTTENTIQNLNTTSASALNLLMPNLSTNNFHTFRMGVTTTQNNCAEFRFTLTGTNSTANSLGLAFFGTSNLYSLTVTGIHTFTGSNALFSIPVVINSTLNSAALTCTTINTQGNTINSGQINATLINATTVHATGFITPFAQGSYLLWNRDGNSGTASLVNQQGSGTGGFEFLNFNSANVLLPGRFILDTSGSGTFTNVMNSASIITGAISSGAITTNNNTITSGPIITAFIDGPGQNVAIGYNTLKSTQSIPTFTVYNNITDRLALFAVNTSGTSAGSNSVVITPPLYVNNTITSGPIITAFIDGPGQNVAIGYNTLKSTQSVPTFTVYNNITDRLALFAVNTSGTSAGSNSVVITPPLYVNNLLSVVNSSGVENNIQNTNTSVGGVLNLLTPNLSVNGSAYFRNGVSVSGRNSFELSFNYVGSNNTSNAFGIGFVGISPLYSVTTIGVHVFTGTSATFGIPIIGNTGLFIVGGSAITSQGTSIQWNRNIGSGATSFINQQGGGNGGFEFLNFNSSNIQFGGKFTLDTSGSGIFTGAMSSSSIATGAITATSLFTSGNITIANGSALYVTNIDTLNSTVAVGYNTGKQSNSVPTFTIYNNNIDRLLMFAATTLGSGGGTNNIAINVPLYVNNLLTVINNTGVENLLQNAATTPGAALNLLMPNLSTGGYVYFRNGVSVSSRNAYELSFNYVSAGNTANSFGIGFVGIAPLYSVTTIGAHVFTGTSATFGIPVTVNNVLTVLNSTTSENTIQNTLSTNTAAILNLFSPNLTANSNYYTQIRIGVNTVANNCFEQRFFYTSSQSTSNYIGFGFYQTSLFYTLTAGGAHVFTGVNATFSIPMIVNNSINASNIYTTGSVGIGNSSPQYTLDVSGNILARNAFLRTTGNTGLYNDTYGGGWYMTDTSAVRVYGDKNIATAGSLFASAGNFSSNINANDIHVSGFTTPNTQGAIFGWNRDGTTGKMCFANQQGSGFGGFEFVNYDGNFNILAGRFTMDNSGNGTFTGAMNATSVVCSGLTTLGGDLQCGGQLNCFNLNTRGNLITTLGLNSGYINTSTLAASSSITCASLTSSGAVNCNTLSVSSNTTFNSIFTQQIQVTQFLGQTSQGAAFSWNRESGKGKACFTNSQGGGSAGGFEFLHYDSNYNLLPGFFYMQPSGDALVSGNFTSYSNITANGSMFCNGLNTNGNTLNAGSINCGSVSCGSLTTNNNGVTCSFVFASATVFSNGFYSNNGSLFAGGGVNSGDFSIFYGGHTLSGNNANAYCNGPGVAGTSGTGNTKICVQFYESVLFSNGWFVNSDSRIKKDIVYVSQEHEILLALKPCMYTNIDFTKNVSRKHGLIAQEVEAVFPDAITNGTDAIPNIIKLVDYVSDRSFTTDAELQLGKIRLYVSDIIVEGIENKENKEIMLDCEIIEKVGNVYTVDKDLKKVIFVYGEFIDDFKSIEYNTFVPLLIAGYQSQEARIKQLETQVQMLINKLT